MITVKQVLENYDILTEKADNDSKNLVALVHAGLLDESQLPILRRAMSKPAINMTEAEKKALHSLVESVSSCIISEKQDYLSKLDTSRSMGYPPEKDIPAVIILKRKAIRVYPDNQKVALYYSQALDRYISIPYGKNSKALDMTLNEERLDEISQELATKAYVERLKRLKAIESDPNTNEIQKGINVFNNKQKLDKLSQRMVTSVVDKNTGKPIRPWAGQSAVDSAEKMAELNPSEKSKQDIYDTAAKIGVGTRKGIDRLVGKGVGMLIKKPTIPLKETKVTFKKHLEMKRQNDLNEWEEKVLKGLDIADKVSDVAMLGGLAASATGIGVGAGAPTALAGLTSKLATKGAKKLAGNWLNKRISKKAADKATKKAAAEATKKPSNTMRWLRRGGGALAAGAGAAIRAGVDAVGKSAEEIGKAFSDASKPAQQNRPEFGGSLGGAKSVESKPSGFSAADLASINQQMNVYNRGQNRQQMPTMAMRESKSNLQVIANIVENNISSQVIHFDKTPITINKRVAKKVMNVYESLNKQNKKKIEKMLNENAQSFKKVINFVVKA